MKGILLSIFVWMSFLSYGQNKAIIKGVVADARTKETLIGVNILYGENKGTTTDAQGFYQLELEPGYYTLTFRYLGYIEEVRSIRLIPGQTYILNVEMKSEVKVLDVVVVSAGRHEQKLSDVTVSMAVIKPQLIESNNIRSLEEAIQKVPGVFIMDDQASIRGGSGYQYGAGSRTLLLVDDLPMLTGASGEARWDFAPIENMDQVEIIKGASSALYGSSALNGVINIRTKFPGADPSSSITMYSGIYGNPRRPEIKWWKTHSPFFSGVRFGHAQRFGQLDLAFGGNIFSETGYQENNNEQRIRFNSNIRYRFKKVEGLSVGVSANYMNRTGDIFLLWLDGDSGVWRANPDYQQSFNNSSINVYPYITYFVNQYNKHTLKTRFYSIRNRNDTEQNNYDDSYYAEYQYQKTFKNQLVWISGASILYNESESQIFGERMHYGSNAAFYSQVDHKLWGRLNISLGGRLEGFRIDEEDLKFRPVFRSGLNYSVNEKTFIRASYGMGYRYPTIAERYTATSTGTIRIFPNPNLKDETGWSAELGVRRGLEISGWNGYLDVAGFWTEYRNMIEFEFGYHNPDTVTLVPFPPTHPNFFLNWIGFKADNVRNARIYGVDIAIAGEGKFFGLPANLLAGYTYTNPIDMDQSQMNEKSTNSRILKYRFYHNAKFDFEITHKQITIGLNSEYCSHVINIDRVFEDTVRFPNGDPIIYYGKPVFLLPGLKEYREKNNKGFVVFDARLGWNVSDKVRLTATVKNLFNKEYMIRPGDVQPPRTYIMQLTVRI